MQPIPPDSNDAERQLDALFAAYREACPAPEPSPNFMPRLWEQIEARRSVSYTFGRLTKLFVSAAAAICILLGLLQAYLPSQPNFYTQTYFEVLDQEIPTENSQYVEAMWVEDGGGS